MSQQITESYGNSTACQYVTPHSVEEALGLLREGAGQARIVAGGTDVLPGMRAGKIQTRCLVDITRIPGLDQINVTDEFVEVGAAVTFADLKDSTWINRHVQALADAARAVGSLAIQNAATWVGNVVQAMPAADGAIIAIALDAEAYRVDGHQAVWQPVETLFQGPGLSAVDPTRQLVTHIRFPRPGGAWGSAWQRIGLRPSLVLPILNCAVSLQLSPDGGCIERAAIALGPVAPRPFRARPAEAFLAGQPPTRASLAEAARLVRQEANPRDSARRASRAYRLAIIPALVQDALEMAAQRAGPHFI